MHVPITTMHSRCSHLHSLTPSITSLTCTRVILEFRGLFLHSGTQNPHPYAPGTLPSYRNNPGDDQKDYSGGSLPSDHRNLSLDFFVSDPRGTTGHFTSAGAYELTTFGNNTVEMGVGPDAGLTESPSGAPSAQSPYGPSALNHGHPQVSLTTEHHDPPTISLPCESKLQVEEGRGEDDERS